jgi:hypothetical protein
VPACPDGKTPKPKSGVCPGQAPNIDLSKLFCPGGGFRVPGQQCPTAAPTPPPGKVELCPNGQPKVNATCPAVPAKPLIQLYRGKSKLLGAQPDNGLH